MRHFAFFSLYQVSKARCIFYIRISSQFGLAAFLLEILGLTVEGVDSRTQVVPNELNGFLIIGLRITF